MRIHFGSIQESQGPDPESEGSHEIHGPRGAMSQLLASLTGLFLLVVPIAGLCLVLSTFAIPNPEVDPNFVPPVAWGAVLLAILSYIPLHELLHLAWHPRFGASDQSILVVWPAKLLFGVYYEGCMSRTRWILMRVAPLVFLSMLPAAFIAIFQYVAFGHMIKTFLEVLMVLNTVGCGADVAAIFLILPRVPPSASMCFRGGRAYWKEATPDSTSAVVKTAGL